PGAEAPPRASRGAPPTPGAGVTPSAWYTAAVRACQDLRAGTLDGVRRTELLRVMKGRAGALAFCDSLLGDGGSGGSGSGSGGDGSGGDGSGEGGGQGEGQGGGGYLPPGGGYGPNGGGSSSPSTSPTTSPEPGGSPRQPNGHQSEPPAPSSSATSSPAPASSPSAHRVLPRELLPSDPGVTDGPTSP
ncbi:hypothetical protein JFN87_27795, partial [Streptomyces bomunensis]|nr:hypothetical protein [Streptomyces montanisoli]